MNSLNTTLSQRGAIYGDYEEGSQFIANIMEEMEATRKRQGYLPLTEEEVQAVLLSIGNIFFSQGPSCRAALDEQILVRVIEMGAAH